MSNIKTFEGFFDFLKRDKSNKPNQSKNKNRFSIQKFNPFNKKDNDLAEKVYNSLKTAIESKDKSQLIGDIVRYGDYKRNVKFKGKEGNTYIISIQKSSNKRRTTSKLFLTSGEKYTLIINNKHFIDNKTGESTVSQGILSKIWNLLDKEYDRKWFNKEEIEKDFE